MQYQYSRAFGIDEFGNIIGFAGRSDIQEPVLWIQDPGHGATPFLKIAPCQPDGKLKLQLMGEAGRCYELQHSSDLVNWATVVRTNIQNTLFYYQQPDTIPTEYGFFRALLADTCSTNGVRVNARLR